jgi:hypothetical protein
MVVAPWDAEHSGAQDSAIRPSKAALDGARGPADVEPFSRVGRGIASRHQRRELRGVPGRAQPPPLPADGVAHPIH